MLVVSALAVLLVALQNYYHPPCLGGEVVLRLGQAGLMAGLLGLGLVRTGAASRWLARLPAESGTLRAHLLALHLGLGLLLLPAFPAVWRSRYYELPPLLYEFLDKRWLPACYWVAIFTTLVLPLVLRAWLWPSPLGAAPAPVAVGGWRRRGAVLAAAGLAFYFAGPPWNLQRHAEAMPGYYHASERYHTTGAVAQAIDPHEQIHLGPLQAIDRGSLPYVGPASNHYGPGWQLCAYAYMKASGRFDVTGSREATALCHFLTTLIFALVVFTLLPFAWALAALVLALSYSPLTYFLWSDGVLVGFYGWANGLRYAGSFLLLATLPALLRRVSPGQRISGGAYALGVLWGAFCWMGQENLSNGVAGMTLLVLLLAATRTVSLAACATVLLSLAAGWLTFWLPVAGFYAYHGALGDFLRHYLLIPGLWVQGYGNLYWPHGFTHAQGPAFYFTPLFLLLLGVGLLRGRDQPLTRNQALLLAFLCHGLASYNVVVLRSFSCNLQMALLALPVIAVLAVAELPPVWARTRAGRGLLGGALVAVILGLYPFDLGRHIRGAYPFQALVETPLDRFAPQAHSTAATDSVPAQRIGTALDGTFRQPDGTTLPLTELIAGMEELRRLVGQRPVYIANFMPPGLNAEMMYFLADLQPAPFLYNNINIFHEELRRSALAHFATIAPAVECLVLNEPNLDEALIFRSCHPQAVTRAHTICGSRCYVLYSRPETVP